MVDLSLQRPRRRDDVLFPVAAVGLDHGHVTSMCSHLQDAGAQIVAVYDRDSEKVARFRTVFPDARVARSVDEILQDHRIRMVASAVVPDRRTSLGLAAHRHEKHFFSAKPGFLSLDQVQTARESVARSGCVWAVCYNERVENEAAVRAGYLIADGAIGDVVQVIGLGPHRLAASSRPRWFFDPQQNGGILVNLGCHQIEQILAYTGATDARVLYAATANHTARVGRFFDEFGEAAFVTDRGGRGYCRVDWLTPDGLSTFGDGRAVILGTTGYIEVRKNVDPGGSTEDNILIVVDQRGEHRETCRGTVGLPYFRALVEDCLDGTARSMPQEHVFRVAELSIEAEKLASGARPGDERGVSAP